MSETKRPPGAPDLDRAAVDRIGRLALAAGQSRQAFDGLFEKMFPGLDFSGPLALPETSSETPYPALGADNS